MDEMDLDDLLKTVTIPEGMAPQDQRGLALAPPVAAA
jgi:hypothetical protein